MLRLSSLVSHRTNSIKLTMVVAAAAIVAAMVLPIYNDQVKRGHRANARVGLLHAAQWMERAAAAHARNAAVTRVSGNFFNATQLARANAMRMSRHTLVQVMDADLGWVGGWRVYADIDRDMEYTAGTDNLIIEHGPAGDGVMSNGPSGDKLEDRGTVADGYLLFNPAGFPRSSTDGIANGSVVFYLPEGRATAVVYSQAGRFRRCDPTKTGCRPDPSAP